jgi:hypothetical protein
MPAVVPVGLLGVLPLSHLNGPRNKVHRIGVQALRCTWPPAYLRYLRLLTRPLPPAWGNSANMGRFQSDGTCRASVSRLSILISPTQITKCLDVFFVFCSYFIHNHAVSHIFYAFLRIWAIPQFSRPNSAEPCLVLTQNALHELTCPNAPRQSQADDATGQRKLSVDRLFLIC